MILAPHPTPTAEDQRGEASREGQFMVFRPHLSQHCPVFGLVHGARQDKEEKEDGNL